MIPRDCLLEAFRKVGQIVAYWVTIYCIMRHGVRSNNLGSGSGYRKTLFRSLAESFVVHGKVCTFLPRAKIMRSILERMITRAKRQDKPAFEVYRSLSRFGLTQQSMKKLVSEIAPRYKDRPGGYVRVTLNGFNKCSNPLAVISLV